MYDFTHWKQALAFLLKTPSQEEQILQIENTMDTYFLREASRRYRMVTNAGDFESSFSEDLKTFKYKFNTDERAEFPAYHAGLAAKIKALKDGDELAIPATEAKIEAVRAVAYYDGFSVIKTETGCIVKHKITASKLKGDISMLLVTLSKAGEFKEITCNAEMLPTVRVYVSQTKDKEAKFSVQLIGEKARITKIK